jgi:nicotinamide-nucleotide amidase
MTEQLIRLATALGQQLQQQKRTLAIAESCTGGGVCQVITEIAGSSAWFDCGFICYSNAAKIKLLGVNPQTLATFGAVSQETALEMAQGALQHSGADYALSVTGIAGPDGGSVKKPVGTVFIAVQTPLQAVCYENHFSGNRNQVRQQSIEFALKTLLTSL